MKLRHFSLLDFFNAWEDDYLSGKNEVYECLYCEEKVKFTTLIFIAFFNTHCLAFYY